MQRRKDTIFSVISRYAPRNKKHIHPNETRIPKELLNDLMPLRRDQDRNDPTKNLQNTKKVLQKLRNTKKS